MLLTFSKKEFRNRIIEGIKVHTIRDDKHKWKKGTKIHFWLGNPRNTKGKVKPYQFGVGEVSRVENIQMDFAIPEDWQQDIVYIGNDIVLKSINELNALAENDGFDNWADMKQWFVNSDMQYFGKIIFWKNFELVTNVGIELPKENVKLLLRETAMRSRIAFPENEQDHLWWNESVGKPLAEQLILKPKIMKKFEEITEEEAINIAHLASGINIIDTTFKIVGRNFEMINLRMELSKNNETKWKSVWLVQIYRNGDVQRTVDGVCVPIYDQLCLSKKLIELKVVWDNER